VEEIRNSVEDSVVVETFLSFVTQSPRGIIK
jgi:hypothetical protein